MCTQLRHRIVQLGIVLLLVVMVVAPAAAVDGVIEINQAKAKAGGVTAGDTPLFPVTISQSGSYRLTSNLDLTDATARPGGSSAENTTAISITANDVSLDLNGFTIKGPTVCTGEPPTQMLACTPTGTGRGIDGSSVNSVRIFNGTVRGMGDAGIILSAGARVERVHVISNGSTGIFVQDNSTVIGSTALQNDSIGIAISGGGGVFSNNTAVNNSGSGIQGGGTVVNNTARRNAGSGITSADAAIGNTAQDNGGFGLNLGATAGYTNNVLTGNNGGNANPQVTGGIQMPAGSNVCGTDTVCP